MANDSDDMDDSYETHHEQQYRKQIQILEDSLQPEHSAIILDFLAEREESMSPGTARNYSRELKEMTLLAYENDRYSNHPEDWSTKDWKRLIRRTARKRDLKDGSKRNTVYAARAFIKWSIDSEADPEELDAPKQEHSKIDEDNVLKFDEVMELIENTKNSRNKAIIGLLYESALRRTALTQLDIKHYLTEPFSRIKLPDKIGVKTGIGGERPITWSAGYIDSWLTDHPLADDPDAPLFVSLRNRDNNGRLSDHSIYTMLKRVAERTDIENDRVHPHALRHARATQLRKNPQFDKSDIELFMGWTDSTPMHARYEHATATEKASRTAQKMGIDVSEETENQVRECPRCNHQIPTGSRYCPTCTLKIDGSPPTWFSLFKAVASETDPLLKTYDALPSTVPELQNLSVDELSHLLNVLHISRWKKRADFSGFNLEHPFDQTTAIPDDEEAEEIIEQIEKQLAGTYQDRPESIELSGQVTESTVKSFLESHEGSI